MAEPERVSVIGMQFVYSWADTFGCLPSIYNMV